MSEWERTPDAIDQASASFWNSPPLDELMADVPPLSADEDYSIEDITDQEWEAFADALRD